jgi:glycosyltransferase involved in cell wall biosynthesis
MSVEMPVATAKSIVTAQTCADPMRVAVICDFLEENWPSMDLNGDLLYRFLAEDQVRDVAATQVRPHFRQRFTRVPMVSGAFGRNVDRLLNRFVDYPRWFRGRLDHFDLFHLVDHSYGQLVHRLPAKRTIVTCHDLDTFRCLLEPEQERRSHWFRAMTQKILNGFQQASHVICNSHSTRDQLLRYRLFTSERITVIHSGVHPAFTAVPDAAADVEAARLLARTSQNEIRLLSVGSTIPRKRMDILLRIFASIREVFPEARLVRVGGAFSEKQLELARQLRVDQSVLVLPFLERNVLASVYRQSTVLLQPSEAEGFGMPLAEAMACGCPVIASDLPALREVGGTACEYAPVGDVETWTRILVSFLQQNAKDGGAEFKRQQSRAQAARYSWAENARRTVEVYRKVLQLQ